MNTNSSLIDYLFGIYGGAKTLPGIMKVAGNWYTVALFHIGIVPSFYLDVRGEGRRIWIGSYADYDRFWRDIGNMKLAKSADHYKNIRVKRDTVEFRYMGKILRFYYNSKTQLLDTINLIGEQFYRNEYKRLDVGGNTVIDIGANVGDSAIYFAMNGARHTYALEPFPYLYGIAKRNVSANKLGDKVTMINAGCDARDSHMRLDGGLERNSGSRLERSRKGRSVPILSLETIARRYCIDGEAVLKMDCEGYEYPAIIKSKRSTLRKFKQMMIEYHDGYSNLEARLRDAGFKVTRERPKTISHSHKLLGLMFASRID